MTLNSFRKLYGLWLMVDILPGYVCHSCCLQYLYDDTSFEHVIEGHGRTEEEAEETLCRYISNRKLYIHTHADESNEYITIKPVQIDYVPEKSNFICSVCLENNRLVVYK